MYILLGKFIVNIHNFDIMILGEKDLKKFDNCISCFSIFNFRCSSKV